VNINNLSKKPYKNLFAIPTVLISLLLISGCWSVTTGFLYDEPEPEELSNEQLCRSIRNSDFVAGFTSSLISEPAVAEAEKRNIISASELDLVKNKQIKIGMSECALRASLGGFPAVNTTVGSYGTHKQFVFSGGYVYVENGKVTSWQFRD
jgi:hypothetical protein